MFHLVARERREGTAERLGPRPRGDHPNTSPFEAGQCARHDAATKDSDTTVVRGGRKAEGPN